MGKKGSWFSAIKRVFTPRPKEKPPHESEKKNAKEKKGRGILRHGETKSFIPLFRGPSSIEQILGEADEQKLLARPPTSEQPSIASELPVRPTSPRVSSPRTASPCTSYRVTSPKATSPRVASPRANSQRITSPRTGSQRVTSPIPASPRATSPRTTAPPCVSSARLASPRATSPRTAAPPSTSSARPASPKVSKKCTEISYVHQAEPTLETLQLSATKIQAAYRGYMARRSFRALRGLVRLQGVVRSGNVNRQTVNAMKQMQLLVRVQTQIQSRRIQMLENQALQRQAYRSEKEVESTLSKWTQSTEAGNHGDWDDSLLTKEEEEARMRKKVEAMIKRERAMAYAYSHQLWKSNPKSAMDIRVGGFPWWWNWLERQLPPGNASESQSAVKDIHLTPPHAMSEQKPSPRLSNHFRHLCSEYDNHETASTRSTKSAVPVIRGRWTMHTPGRTPPMNSSGLTKYSMPRAGAANSPFDVPLKDDDSLTSCPPFSVPNYMTPTISAKAKLRPNSNPKERNNPGTPSNGPNRRFSFPLTPKSGSFKWNKGSNKDATSQMENHDSMGDHVSVDSTVSMPAVVGRKPFNRFV